MWLALAGVAGGILGGMGFGGGMLLIPILTFFLGVSYPVAAWVNLVVFLPTAIVALVMHAKHGMLEPRSVRYMSLFAFIGLAFGLLFGGNLSERTLRRAFGIFLICVGAVSSFFVLFGFFKKNKR